MEMENLNMNGIEEFIKYESRIESVQTDRNGLTYNYQLNYQFRLKMII